MPVVAYVMPVMAPAHMATVVFKGTTSVDNTRAAIYMARRSMGCSRASVPRLMAGLMLMLNRVPCVPVAPLNRERWGSDEYESQSSKNDRSHFSPPRV